MVIQGSEQIPKMMRWKDGERLIAVNQRDNGYLPTGDPMTDKSGQRYEADFTIVKDTDDIVGAIDAFTRMTTDPVQDQLVVDNIEIDGEEFDFIFKGYSK